MIKKFFFSNQLAPSFPQAMAAPNKANKGITKLMFMHICTNIIYKGSSMGNILFATPSNGMEVVLSQPHAARPISLADLICQTLLMTKEQDNLSIWSKYLSIQMVGKTLATHMLSGNFATDRVTTLNNEVNSINPSAFLPQRNACMTEQEQIRDMITNTLTSMVVLNMHKSKGKISIACIGTITSILHLSSLCINMVLEAVTKAKVGLSAIWLLSTLLEDL
jgi:hypothetical protein